MFEFLTGRVVESGPGETVLDVQGVGYRLAVSAATAGRLPPPGDVVTLFAHHLLRDERFQLYGFLSKAERSLFERLLGVSKVGPTLALALLSALEPGALVAAIDAGDVATLSRVKGAFSLAVLTGDALIAARDPHGFRPLSLGRLDGAWVVASETCALDLIGATHERDLDPGEVVVIRRGRLRSLHPFKQEPEHFCIFEYIYFARPDSHLNHHNVYEFRKELGRTLAREHPVKADIVVPVLDSGNTAALGFAEESGIPYDQALIRNHYVRRTFIEPAQSIRHFGVKVKHNAVKGAIAGKRVVLCDDSIVRGTTLTKIVSMIRNAGASEVHLRISSPPTVGPCHYGVNTPTREELIAHTHTVQEIQDLMGADSLGYLTLDGLRGCGAQIKRGTCDACFSNEYPVDITDENTVPQLSLFRVVGEEE